MRKLFRSSSMLLFLILMALGIVATYYGYYLYTRTSTVKYYSALDYPSYTWINGLSLWWSLAPNDHIQLLLLMDSRLNPFQIFLDISVLQGIAPTTSQTAGLLQSWNITWAQWMNLANDIFTLNFTASHYYNIRLDMYINANTTSVSRPMLYTTIIWRDPMDIDSGRLFLGVGITSFAASVIPFIWRPLETRLRRRQSASESNHQKPGKASSI